VIKNYRATHPNVLPVSGGGWAMGGTLESQKTQSFFLAEAMGMLGYSVVNVAPVDITYGVETLRQAAQEQKLDLVSSNLKRKSDGKLVFHPYVVRNVQGIRVGFMGVMQEGEALAPLTTEGDDLEVVEPLEAVRTLLPEVRAKSDVVVVLSHITQRKTRQLVDEVKGIDIAISGGDGFLNQRVTEVGNDSLGRTYILEAGERGKYAGVFTMVVSEHGKILRYTNEAHQLDKNIKDDSLMALQVENLKTRLKEVRKREAVEQAVGAANPGKRTAGAHDKFLGAQICARCHQTAYDSWKTSPHANSMASLEAKAMENAAECLKCHVTGYNMPSGFPTSQGELGAVSCEQCHGQGTLHGDTKFVLHPGVQSCTTCHDRSSACQKERPEFDYKTAWAKIAH
jgi:hypothetical protein